MCVDCNKLVTLAKNLMSSSCICLGMIDWLDTATMVQAYCDSTIEMYNSVVPFNFLLASLPRQEFQDIICICAFITLRFRAA